MTAPQHSALILARIALRHAALDLACARLDGADLTPALALLRHRLENLRMVEDYITAEWRGEVVRVIEVIEAREVIAMPEWVQ